MSAILDIDFESLVIGNPPSGGGSGTWAVSPAGSCVIAADPIADSSADQGNVLHCNGAHVSSGSKVATYTLPTPYPTGLVVVRWLQLRDTVGPNEDAGLEIRSSTSAFLQAIAQDNGGSWRYEGGFFYTQDDHESGPTTLAYLADTWYQVDAIIDIANQMLYAFIDAEPVGRDNGGAWEWGVPFNAAGSNVRYLQFYVSESVAQRHAYFDDIQAYSSDTLSTAPERITLATDFAVDSYYLATATRPAGSGTVVTDYASVDTNIDKAIHNSRSLYFRSSNAEANEHYLTFDLGSGVAKSCDLWCILDHNWSSFGVSLVSVRIHGSNYGGDLYHAPDVLIDITDYVSRDPLVAWLDNPTACRYWAIVTTINEINVLGAPDYIQIGRIIGTDTYWTPTRNFRLQFDWPLVDPSIVHETEANVRNVTARSKRRECGISFTGLSLSDQDALESMAENANPGTAWLALLAPQTYPERYVLYGYLDQPDLGWGRGFQQDSNLVLSFKEIVSEVDV